mmetsp:Transcript_11036/g.24266  ORF Transcript_11036/g.24266 Transcript_11036/m.24266 type:complete len:91 (-) Transcript_11036:142-414(-)
MKRTEVAEHNRTDDCWVVINRSVYNLTDFVQIHPGGRRAIIKHAGTDATIKYTSVSQHTASSNLILEKYKIGELHENEEDIQINQVCAFN